MSMNRRNFLFAGVVAWAAQPPRYDLVIRNARIVDGAGRPAFSGSVALRGDTIAAVGDVSGIGAREIDAGGLAIAPGFIDIHNHSDHSILIDGSARSMVRQGVTTMVLGESGSPGPVLGKAHRRAPEGVTEQWRTLGDYFRLLERRGVATNIASFVGLGQVWECAVGYEMRRPTAAERAEMRRLVAQAMEEGALGLSCSLITPPSSAATREEILELVRVVKKYGGSYLTHIRHEGSEVFAALREAIEIGRAAAAPVEVLHLKIADRAYWGRMNEVVALFEQARAEGVRIAANVYPYHAGQNNLAAIVPPWAHDGGTARMLERLRDPGARARMKREILDGLPGWYNHYTATGGWEGMLLVALKDPRNKPFQGRRMSELIAARGGDPVMVLFDVLWEENGSVPCVYFHHREEDMQMALRQPWCSIGSDGSAVRPDGPLGASTLHPRSYGAFPRVLGRYVRELKLLSLEEAVRKMTSLNAGKIGAKDRGLIREGLRADLVIFDPATIADRATYEQPHQYAVGVEYVLVNGRMVLERGEHTDARPGRVLSGGSFMKSRLLFL